MQEKELTLKDYWQIIWSHRKFIIITVSIVIILAVIISLLLPKWYKATSVIMPPETEQASLGSLANSELSAFGIGGILGGSENQKRLLTILKSRRMLELLDEKFNFQKKFDTEFKFQTYDKIRSNLRIEVGEEEQIKITFYDKDQNLVAKIVNYVVNNLDRLNIKLANNKAKKNKEFIKTRIEGVRDSLILYENKITKFMDDNDLISIDEQLKEEVTHAAEMKATIMFNEIELQVLESKLTPNSRKILDQERKIKFLNDKYENFFSPNETDELFVNLKNIPDFQKKFAQLKRKAVYFTKLLEYLGPQYEQAKIKAAKDIPTIQIIDTGRRPEWKSRPKRALIVVLALLISFFLTISVILIKEYFHSHNQ